MNSRSTWQTVHCFVLLYWGNKENVNKDNKKKTTTKNNDLCMSSLQVGCWFLINFRKYDNYYGFIITLKDKKVHRVFFFLGKEHEDN